MVSIRVRVLNKDNRSGGRNIDVSLGAASFKTPTRAATHKEYKSASARPFDITIKNPVSEYVSSFDNPQLDAFLSGNGSFMRRRQKMAQSMPMMRYFPSVSSIKMPKGRRIEQDELMLFDQFQKDEFEVVSIPPFVYNNIDDYKKIIIRYSDFARSRGQEAMPILPMSTELSTFKLEFGALRELNNDNDLCKVIGFSYANPSSHIQQYQEIYKHRSENIWYHGFGVLKTQRNNPAAIIHELQVFGIDTFSPDVKYSSPGAAKYFIFKNKNTRPEDVTIPRRFDYQTLGVLGESDWRGRYGHDICCSCPVCQGNDLSSFKDAYTHDLDGSFTPTLLNDADRVHTLISGSNEFNESREAIKSDDLHTYYNSKEFTKPLKLENFLKIR